MTTVTRRNVLKGGTALVGGMAGILAAGRAPAYAQATTVHWLRWTDFVPASDQLLRNEIAKEGEKALGIKLNIETINANDIQARVTSAIQSGSGPDVVCVLNNWGQLYGESVIDVSDIAEELGKGQGGFYETSRAVANDGKKWIAVPWCIVGLQIAYRKSWFAEIGYTDGKFPQTWEEYREAGKKLKAKGRPVGQTLGHTFGDAPAFTYPYLWSWGGKEVEADGKTVVLNSPATVESVKFMVAFWKDAHDEGGLAWDDSNNNRAFLSGTCSATLNGASIYIEALRKPDTYKTEAGGATEGRHPARRAAQGPRRAVQLSRPVLEPPDGLFEEPGCGEEIPWLDSLQGRLQQVVRLPEGLLGRPDHGLGKAQAVGRRPDHAALQASGAHRALRWLPRALYAQGSRGRNQVHHH